ncbi:hypothetical protein DFH08DRAFT_1088986 [Mycena albidolilacea]|uniref:Uncharacterized protein n=1 Tax=Mycena albidolilacea TaxID=1033008 RepID=A0AAD6Z381_9AGAR|nr:hypothetical protein DFH08DRAFT_1088986 [Mycena albidolilacea]
MLLLLLVHILHRNDSAAPLALPLAPRTSTNTCDDVNTCRKLFDIVWGCLATIFACTWVSVHPNVPPPDQSQLALFWRRLKMMLIGIIAPEIMVGFAAGQCFSAWMLAKQFKFSRTHGFFFCMGGFVSSAGYPVTTQEQLEDPELGPEFLKGIQRIRAEEITDKSKGDAFSKGVALAQGIWFTTQCLARLHQRIAITELEWDKPLDVQLPIIVGPPTPLDAQPIIPHQRWWFNRFLDAIIPDNKAEHWHKEYDPLSSTSVPSFWAPSMGGYRLHGTVGTTALAGSVFGAIHCAAWNTDFPTTAEIWLWRSCSLTIAAIPVVLLLAGFLIGSIDNTPLKQTKLGNAIYAILGFVMFGTFPIYIAARLILIALPLAVLRSLPPSVFVDVNWSMYIPHI